MDPPPLRYGATVTNWRETKTANRKRPTANCELRGPSENYGSGEHTTVAAFLPWRGL